MNPVEYCQSKVAQPGTSLYYSLLFLPEHQKQAVTALYAYQKEISDIVIECPEIIIAETKLQWWQEEISRLFAGHPKHPITQSLAYPISIYNLPQELFLKVIEGVTRNLEQFTYPTFENLVLYCYQIAGTISAMAAKIYGYQDQKTRKYAEQLGIALQLTHILRNVRQDADRGRVYLSQDTLDSLSISIEDLLAGNNNIQNLSALFAHYASQIRHYLHNALTLLNKHNYYSQRAGLIQAALCLSVLDAIEEDGYLLLQRQTTLTPLRKLWIAWRTSRRSQRGLIPKH
ncbi:squalene/phytoene synthase [Candidatus Nitrosoglobus terrae]|uniref:Squalene/phytoene synthase n=1 Tax=Candidatus Nitrosoglobus terrae TaxID=1630141 RepID=A0A1Q2SK26_9GAMM|nr:presqualene diphosphate synthase HpnD [Candidatus Nitrosoglobus terrae]BAW79491.1 squalene/phytoene synthase [Candidatus Nitrosoglobus terrae]